MNTSTFNPRKLAFAFVLFFGWGLSGYGQPSFSWVKGFGGTGGDFPATTQIDQAGNVYTLGYFMGTVDFDPGPGVSNLVSAGIYDVFILKLNPNGDFVWAKKFGSTAIDYGRDLVLDGLGNPIFSIDFRLTIDADPGTGTSNFTAPNGFEDILFIKLDASGNFVWARQVTSTSNESAFSLTQDPSGNIISSGIFGGTTDFDPGPGVQSLSAASGSIFVLKLDPTGNFIWVKSFGSTTTSVGYAVECDDAGAIYVTGQFGSSGDFDPGAGTANLTSAGGTDCYFLKLTSSGNFRWVKKFGTTGEENAFSIVNTGSNHICAVGYFNNTIDFDPGPSIYNLTSAGLYDAFYVNLDTAGNFVWAKNIGGSGSDYAYATSDGAGSVYSLGGFQNTVDLDPGPGVQNFTSLGGEDAFIQKMDAAGNFLWAGQMGGTGSADQGISVAVNASGKLAYTGRLNATGDFDPTGGTATLTCAGSYDLFVGKLDYCAATAANVTQVACNSYLSPSGNHTWTSTGIYADTIPNVAGCDSILTINLTINTTPAQPNPISGNSFPCVGTTNTYAVTAVPGATSYIWTLPVGWTGSSTSNSLNATAGSAGGTITVTATNACGNSTVRSLTVGVNTPPPSPSILMAPSQICINSNVQFAVMPVPGATSYTWTLPVGWTGSSTTDVINVVTGSSGGPLTVTANNVCGASTPPFTSNITLLTTTSQPGPINGPTAVCAGATVTYSVTPVPGASAYQWSIPSGWTGSSTTNTITVVAGSVGGVINVNTTNFCGNSLAQSLNVTITALPSQPNNILGNDTVCANSTNTYSVPAVSGATGYTWSLPNGWTGSSTSNSLNATAGSVGGTITVTANNSCGSSAAQTIAVTVNSVPAQPGGIAGLTTICEGFTDLYSISPIPGATSYTWILPSGWAGSSGSSSISATVSANGGTISVTANNACGSSAAQTQVITVQPLPSLTGQMTGDVTVCEGESYTYAVSPDPYASSYTWTLPSGWAGSSVSNSVSATAGLNGGTVSVTSTNSCGTSNPVNLSVTVALDPTAAFTSTSNLLVVTFTNTSSTSSTWYWDFGDGNTSTLQHPVHTYASAGTYNVCLTATENSCSATTCNLVTVVAVGIEDDLGLGEVLVWPNPSAGVFQVKCQSQLKGEVMDVHGRVVYQQTFEAGTTALDLTGYANGVYFLRLAEDERRASLRLVKVGD